MRKLFVAALVAVVGLSLMLGGCNRKPAGEKKIRIGYTTPALSNQFWNRPFTLSGVSSSVQRLR